MGARVPSPPEASPADAGWTRSALQGRARSCVVVLVDVTPYALGRDEGELLRFGEGTILVRASYPGASVWEEIPPVLDTPMHVHANEDELFHVIDGEHEFRCGEEQFRVGPGAFVFLPRGIPHGHRRLVAGEGRMLVITTPGGFDGFFRILAEAHEAGELGPDAYARASAEFGITWIA